MTCEGCSEKFEEFCSKYRDYPDDDDYTCMFVLYSKSLKERMKESREELYRDILERGVLGCGHRVQGSVGE